MNPSAAELAAPFAGALEAGGFALAGMLCLAAARRELAATPLAIMIGASAVSAATALLVSFADVGFGVGAALALLALTCVLIAETDRRHHLIPDSLVAAVIVLAFVAPSSLAAIERVGAAALLGGMFFLVRKIGAGLRGAEVLGLGDVKLAAAMGAFLGLQPALVAVAAAGVATLLVVSLRSDARARAGAPFGIGLSTALAVVACAQPWL